MSQVLNLVQAYDNFIKGCKSDGTWDAIKASCIMAGWDGLNGALTPLKGDAPTNFNFVSGDYNRTTGLVGDGTTKYLDSNRANNADPQDNFHLSAYLSSANSGNLIGASGGQTGASQLRGDGASRSRNAFQDAATTTPSGLFASSRSASGNYLRRANGITSTVATASQTPSSGTLTTHSTGALALSDARIAFYSIGESLDLASLDARVTTLTSAITAALP
jgi:hypothetical protein